MKQNTESVCITEVKPYEPMIGPTVSRSFLVIENGARLACYEYRLQPRSFKWLSHVAVVPRASSLLILWTGRRTLRTKLIGQLHFMPESCVGPVEACALSKRPGFHHWQLRDYVNTTTPFASKCIRKKSQFPSSSWAFSCSGPNAPLTQRRCFQSLATPKDDVDLLSVLHQRLRSPRFLQREPHPRRNPLMRHAQDHL